MAILRSVFTTKKQKNFLWLEIGWATSRFTTLSGGKLFFASEIKAFKTICGLEFDEQTLCDSILFNINDYSESTIYKDIKHLPPAHYGVFDTKSGKLSIKRY